MPNEVYKAAVKGLGALVAPKAAARLVDEALRASNRTADDVSEAAMRRLLLTRVKRELAGIFPDHVVAQSLQRVAAELTPATAPSQRRGLFGGRRAEQDAPAPGSKPGRRRPARGDRRDEQRGPAAPETHAVKPGPVDLLDTDELVTDVFDPELLDAEQLNRSVKRSSAYLPAVDLPEFAPQTPALEAAPGRDATGPADEQQPAAARRGSTGLDVSGAMVERAIRTFADLETVRQIVVVNGMTVSQVRGEGLTTNRLATLTVATKGLLARAGELRVFSLELDDGVLFLFPTRDGAIVVLTQPKVNIGAVLAARADLEEAA